MLINPDYAGWPTRLPILYMKSLLAIVAILTRKLFMLLNLARKAGG